MKCLIKNPNGTKRILKRTQKNARLSFSIIWSFLLRQMQSGFHHRRRLFREKIMGTKRRAFKSLTIYGLMRFMHHEKQL